jgi:hypothetical protein
MVFKYLNSQTSIRQLDGGSIRRTSGEILVSSMTIISLEGTILFPFTLLLTVPYTMRSTNPKHLSDLDMSESDQDDSAERKSAKVRTKKSPLPSDDENRQSSRQKLMMMEGDTEDLKSKEARQSVKKRRSSRNCQNTDGKDLESEECRRYLKKESSRRKKSQESKNKGDEEDDAEQKRSTTDNHQSETSHKLKENDPEDPKSKESRQRRSERNSQEAAYGKELEREESRRSLKKESSRRKKSKDKENKDFREDIEEQKRSTKNKHHSGESPRTSTSISLGEGATEDLKKKEESRQSLKNRRYSRNYQEAAGEDIESEESRRSLKKESSRRKQSEQRMNKEDDEEDDGEKKRSTEDKHDSEGSHGTSTSISLGDRSNQVEIQHDSNKKRKSKKHEVSSDEEDSEYDLETAKRIKDVSERQDVFTEAEDGQPKKDWSKAAMILICVALFGAVLGLVVVVAQHVSGNKESSDEQLSDSFIRPTLAPTISIQPTVSPAPSASPTASPAPTVSRFSTLETLFETFSVSVDAAQPNTPQYRALSWLADEDPAQLDLEATSTKVLLERYVMSVFYFATIGEEWAEQIFFLSASSTCAWRFGTSFATRGAVCGRENQLRMIQIVKKNVGGTLPTELGLLSDLEEINLGANRIGGTLPSELGNLSKLSSLSICK